MSEINRVALKAFFETLDDPTESQFGDLIDSLINLIDDGICGWQKITINYDDFQPAAYSQASIDCFEVPAGYQVNRIILIPSIAFSGGTISSAFIALYNPTDEAQIFNSTLDVFSPITNTSGIISPGYIADSHFLINIATGGTVRIFIIVAGGGDGINDLTQGSVDIYYRLDKISQL